MNNIAITFLCNFRPNWTFKKRFNKKIFAKNFIVFLLFLKFFKKHKSSVFIKPFKKKVLAVLKAPHGFKTSRHLINFSRYEISLLLKFNKTIYKENLLNCTSFFNNLFKIVRRIDSSLCSQKSIKISFNFNFKDLTFSS